MLRVGKYTSFRNIVKDLRKQDSLYQPIIFNQYFMQKGYIKVEYTLQYIKDDFICHIDSICITDDKIDYSGFENINHLIEYGYSSREIYLYLCNNVIIDDDFDLDCWDTDMYYNQTLEYAPAIESMY